MAAPPIGERHKHHFHRQSPIKESVRAATTADITISTALNNGDSLDGVTLATGDRVLVKNQSTGSQNGIYVVGATPVRDYDVSTDDPAFGYLVLVREGTANAGTLWENTNTSAPTIGSTSLTFAQFSGSGAPTGADYLVGTAQGGLSAEIVVGTTPGGELGGTWASPTVDATHAGSTHIALSSATPLVESGAGSAGSGTAASKDDHVHPAAGGSGTLSTVEEVDGSPTDSAVTKLVFPNGTLAIASHVATYTPAAGGSGTLTTVKDEGSTLSSAVTEINFTGAGVTATGTTSVTVNIPGGGSSDVIYPLDHSRTMDGTYGDDFTGSSLDAKWTRVTQGSGEETYQVGPRGSHLRIAYSTGAAVRYIYEDISGLGTSWTFECAFSDWEPTGGSMPCLMALDSSGNGIGVGPYNSAVGVYLWAIASGAYSGTAATIFANSTMVTYQAGQRMWLSLRRASGVYYGSFSFNGETYSAEVSNTPSAFTQARLGFGRIFGANGGHVVDLDWINKTA